MKGWSLSDKDEAEGAHIPESKICRCPPDLKRLRTGELTCNTVDVLSPKYYIPLSILLCNNDPKLYI